MVLSRRGVALGGLALVAVGATGNIVRAATEKSFFAGTASDNNFVYRKTNFTKIDKRWHRQIVKYFSSEPVGTVVVDTRHHFLYLIMENKTAIRYGVGVGKDGFKWYGRATIDRRALWPRWVPPPEMRKRKPDLPPMVAGGASNNPLGPRALYLYRDGADIGYRLHGTLEPWSIGTDASSGCIRMFPEDIIDLYQRCPIGTAVEVLPHIADQAPASTTVE
ncbi:MULTISPECIES: L,D-transpeptidase [Mesorhizobium]|uniref:L,D-transpeptidase n=1 Tax=Mesorhizobium TaxID=68287 RepID=UPI000FD412B1|nr:MULTISPECIES: L,D-transpeptidase [Mesorhizobium]MCF6125825.1 L,D-transpeptidase [Mesorhizobium ciceri]MCQ8818009.1 L,D-transpeptidase [Mesorhizobium sp. SEMIA396]RUU77831.1 L,D-transpeptidase [Mesorhizobium sp. M7A.F.Ca.MR.362.00.0.0]RWN87967.1 MAG: L,D-transpeptidase [Mesorhizobium sp.]